MACIGWSLGVAVMGTGAPDLLATVNREDAFDMTQRLYSVRTPVLVIVGSGTPSTGEGEPSSCRKVLTFLDKPSDPS